jgi:MarR family transcriptional regulator for hemolysin
MKLQKKIEALPTHKKAILQVVAYRRIRTAVNGVLNRFDLNTTQWMMLSVLYESATGLRITDIARSLEVEVPLITRLSRSLIKAGLVESKSNTGDKRTKPVGLTPAGQKVIGKVDKELQKKTAELEEGLSNTEVNGYFKTLAAFMDNAAQGV